LSCKSRNAGLDFFQAQKRSVSAVSLSHSAERSSTSKSKIKKIKTSKAKNIKEV
jgi:hypothetical protein